MSSDTSTRSTVAAAPPPPAALIDDDEIRIDWLRFGGQRSDTLVVTFDPLAYLTDKPPFGHDFLRRQGVDLLAVRKKKDNFYQPLSRAAFVAALQPLLGLYRRVVAYGSSLGAYAALYFCRDVDCTVIASSPRVSAHPRYGDALWQSRVAFRHELFDARTTPRCTAHILYDPKDRIDRPFIEDHVLLQFPAAHVMRLPYSGHPTNHFLSEIGFIAPFVRAVVARDSLPAPDLSRKGQSAAYLVTLAQACTGRGKPGWSERLVDRALQINPHHPAALRTRGRNAMLRGDWHGARSVFEDAIARTPGDHLARHWLALTLKSLASPPAEPPRVAEPESRLAGWPPFLQRLLRALRARQRRR